MKIRAGQKRVVTSEVIGQLLSVSFRYYDDNFSYLLSVISREEMAVQDADIRGCPALAAVLPGMQQIRIWPASERRGYLTVRYNTTIVED